jgi:uncharacterized integral membrane protein
MRVKTGLLIIVIIVAGTFLISNWHMFAVPARFNFLLGSAEMPMGLVIVGLPLLLGLAFGIYAGVWQRLVLNDYRRQSQELQTQRALADDAEASRFTALGALMREELTKLEQRLELALDALRNEVRDTEHSIAATLAEMDDRLRSANPASE